MKTIDIHPDDLLDSYLNGSLPADQRAFVDDHIGQCAACRLHLLARADFDRELQACDDSQGPARAVESVLAKLEQRAIPFPVPRRRHKRLAHVLLVAAALSIAAVAAAGVWSVAHDRRAKPQTEHLPALAANDPALKELRSTLSNLQAAPTASASKVDEVAMRAPPAPSHVDTTAEGATATDLFSKANQARRASRDADAIRLYRELQLSFPNSRETATSQATLGHLLLDHNDPAGALAQFDRYLSGQQGGSVAEEALAGRAAALGRLGRTAEENAAWQTLLSRYPQSVYAQKARERLGQEK